MSLTTDELISRCYEHGQPDYVLAADRLKELQAETASLREANSTWVAQFGPENKEDTANLAAHIWAAGADHETAGFVAKQLIKKGLRLVPDRATEDMWHAGRSADLHKGDSYSSVYVAMIEAAPRA